MEAQQQLFALAAWLQTFPEFDVQVYNGNEEAADAERLEYALNSTDATLYDFLCCESISVKIFGCRLPRLFCVRLLSPAFSELFPRLPK